MNKYQKLLHETYVLTGQGKIEKSLSESFEYYIVNGDILPIRLFV